jgi:putative two-component system response regulator
LVDDDESHLPVVEKILNPDYNLVIAKNGDEALKKIYSGFIPDLVLLDMLMPEIDGWDTYKRIRAIALLHEVKILFFTLGTEKVDLDYALDMGAIDHIIKPFESNDLLSRIEKLLSDK